MDTERRTRQSGTPAYAGRGLLAAAFALLVAALFFPTFLRNFNALVLKTVPAVPAPLRDERVVHAVVLRREVVVEAPRGGVFRPLVQEETRVRAGQTVGLIVSEEEQTAVFAPAPGIVRFHRDGWEGLLTEANVWARSPTGWKAWRDEGSDPVVVEVRPPDGGSVERGDPLLRLVDSHGVGLYADVPAGAGWRNGDVVELMAPDVSSEPLRARVVRTGRTEDTGEGAALLELQRYVPVLDAVRHLELRYVLSSHVGAVAPVDALVWSDGEAGVLVQRGTDVRFRPVVVVAQVGDEVVLEGLSPEDRIVVNPWRVSGR